MLLAAELVLLVLWLRLAVSCALGILAQRGKPPIDKNEGTASRISVVIPALNEEETIGATLSSLFEQEPPPWEILVVDDGSSDRTGELAEQWLSGREGGRVIRLPRNRGKAEALNIGIRAASGDFVATVDADTRLDAGALTAALATLVGRGAGAAAFYLEVANRTTLLERLQRQEYVTSMNFERVGQDAVGMISILPGAATLYRRELLIAYPFSSRTRTEDADLTLELARSGIRVVLAAEAVASTIAPVSVAELLSQRVRWTTGHLQCCTRHAYPSGGYWRFRLGVFPNFVASTLLGGLGLLAMIPLWSGRHTSLLGLDWIEVSLIAIVLAYAQRGCATLIDGQRREGVWIFLLEPAATGLLCISSLLGALYSLTRNRSDFSKNWTK
ncbi:MAG: glycosyltransferase [Methylococcaceae bacterium]|nr:glycosyltransferase [Methylococcaceae bacterium]